jgi:hypothetical protein
MLRPDRVAVALRPPVNPISGRAASETEARASRVLELFGEVASHRSVIPAGGLSVPSALIAARWTSLVSATVVLIGGAATAVDAALFTWTAAASTGSAVSTPE